MLSKHDIFILQHRDIIGYLWNQARNSGHILNDAYEKLHVLPFCDRIARLFIASEYIESGPTNVEYLVEKNFSTYHEIHEFIRSLQTT